MTIRTVADLGALIRDRRRQLGMDQQTLASRIGVSRQWIIEIEQGKARAQVGRLLQALHALGLTVDVNASPERPTARTPVPRSTASADALIESALRRRAASKPKIDLDAILKESSRRRR